MKKNVYSLILLFLFTVNSFVPVHASDTNENSAGTVSAQMLEVSQSRADAAKKRAVDFESPEYFPSEWDAADSLYAVAANMPKTAQENVQQAAVMYENAADAYDEIFRKTIPLYAQAREDEIMDVREKLINTGFRNYFSKYLKSADNKALLALYQFKAGDYYKAGDTAADALNEYETLFTGAGAFLARQEVISRGFALNNADNFEKADETAQRAIYEYEAGNKEAAKTNAEEALFRYNLLIN
jgi:hypothetical protein